MQDSAGASTTTISSAVCKKLSGTVCSTCLPVIASRIGGLPEFVEDEETGLLFELGNAEQLTEKIRRLWNDPALCRQLGEAGRRKAEQEYSEETYYQSLMAIYEKAIEVNARRGNTPHPEAVRQITVPAGVNS